MGKIADWVCKITKRHKWVRSTIHLPCGCSDCLWACTRCGKIERTPFFRSWACKEHQR